MSIDAMPLLRVRDLAVQFRTQQGVARAVDGISFDLHAGETLGLVGESGCGKTVTGLALLGLIPSPPGHIAGGSIEFMGKELVGLDDAQMRAIRGRDISMIFQEPMTALNPVFRIGSHMGDVLRLHQGLSHKQARTAAIEMLAKVGIPEPAQRIDNYPHELSGGMRQRVMIAMALSCGPQLLVADEPTTALDVTTQAQVLEQIAKLQKEFGMAMILVTHDLGVVAETCQRALVMYCGRIVEDSPVSELYATPRHPYTAGLLASIPRLHNERISELPVIPGMVPDVLHLPAGCSFADRCSKVQAICRTSAPLLRKLPDREAHVACYDPN
jgi:oligopeptide/dipeptide ABC transporter ATP-binding protein